MRAGRPGRRRQRERVARDVAVQTLGHDQHTLDRSAHGVAQRSACHVESYSGGVDADPLWSNQVDRAPSRGIEPDVGEAIGRQVRGLDREGDVLGRGDERRGPGARRRNVPSRGRDQRCTARIGCRRARCDRESQRDRGFLGDACLFADEPAGPAAERDAGARIERGRRRHRKREHDLARVPVGHRRPLWDSIRVRPRDLARRESRRQRPLDPRRLTGVSRVHPVGVPARRDLLAQGDPEGLARREGRDLAQELDAHSRSLGGRRGAAQDQENARENNKGAAEAHAGPIIPLVRPASQGLGGLLTPGSGYGYG